MKPTNYAVHTPQEAGLLHTYADIVTVLPMNPTIPRQITAKKQQMKYKS
jgi:hypothetical protein